MVSLVDIVPQKRSVTIAAGELELRGLGLRQIADLLLRFPNLYTLFAQGGLTEPETLLLTAPDAIGAIIAEAAGQPEAADTIAERLAIDDIVACLLVVRDLTLPSDPLPFLRGLAKLLGGAPVSGTDPDMTSPPAPNGSLPPDTMHAT